MYVKYEYLPCTRWYIIWVFGFVLVNQGGNFLLKGIKKVIFRAINEMGLKWFFFQALQNLHISRPITL